MKNNKILLAAILVLVLQSPLFATIWTVNNTPGVNADFSSISEAITAASAGDTLYVQGSGSTYSAVTLSKKLTIFGPGYFLTENSKTQAKLLSARTNGLTFETGSEHSSVIGMVLNTLTLNASNIKVKSNKIGTITVIGSANTIIQNNYVTSIFSTYSNVPTPSINLIVTGNFFGTDAYIGSTEGSAEVTNNTFMGGNTFGFTNSSVSNNIFLTNSNGEDVGITLNNSSAFNNLTPEAILDASNGNIVATSSSIVVGEGEGRSTDGQWVLAAGSPAIGAGFAGEDLGMYGGNSPYVLSGLIGIPRIYEFLGQSVGTTKSGIKVKLKAKSGGN